MDESRHFYKGFHHNFVPEVKEHFKKIGMDEDSEAIFLLANYNRVHPHETELVFWQYFYPLYAC